MGGKITTTVILKVIAYVQKQMGHALRGCLVAWSQPRGLVGLLARWAGQATWLADQPDT